MLKKITLLILILFSATLVVYADTLTLKDGTVLECSAVQDMGAHYFVKLADGTTKTIKKEDVKQWTKQAPGTTSGGSGTPAAGSGATTPNKSTPSTPAPPASGSASFQAAKTKADRQEAPIVAVQIWEKWIEANPNSPELATAKKELEVWTQRNKDEAEKINGKWIGGDEKKKLKEKVDKLIQEANALLEGAGTVQGLAKLDEALKLYPNSFEANFSLGYFYLVKGIIGNNGRGNNAYMDKAVKAMETAAKLQPEIAASWSNLAIAYNFKKRYVESVQVAYKATKLLEDKETVQNLIASLAYAPPGMQNNTKLKEIMDDAFLMATKHGINRQGAGWSYLRPKSPDQPGAPSPDDPAEGRPGPAWSGSGFIVTEDGYIITNHHVATGDPKKPILKNISFRVRLDDGTEKNAELIAVDDAADIAVMKIKADSPLPTLNISSETPEQGAEALVLGYPATGSSEHTLQISKGTVKSLHPGEEYEVWLDLNTTHGNSGGPIVDKEGNVIAILTAGGKVYDMVLTMGVGVKQIEKFLGALGDKAPKVNWTKPKAGIENDLLNSQVLTRKCKPATVLIIAIRGGEPTDATDDKAVGEKKGDETPPADGGEPGVGKGGADHPGGKRGGISK